MTIKKTFKRGFTLIELMIVIVILGILMGTILPRLTGAQARARDTARKADLSNIAQALELYYGDQGTYPAMPTNGCLDPSPTSGTVDPTTKALGDYMKGKKVPVAPSKEQLTYECKGTYFYTPLKANSVDGASYILATTVETWQMSNYAGATAAPTVATDASTIVTKALTDKPTIAGTKTYYAVMP